MLVVQTQAVRSVDGLHQTGALDERLRGGFGGCPQLPGPLFDLSRQECSLAGIAKKTRPIGRGPLQVAAAAPAGRPQIRPRKDAGGARKRIWLLITNILRTAAVQAALLLSIFFLEPGRAQAGLVYHDEPIAESPGPSVVYMDDWYYGGGAGRGTPDAEGHTPRPHVTDYERGERRKSENPETIPHAQQLANPNMHVRQKSHVDFEKSEHIHPEVAKARAMLFGAPDSREPAEISQQVWTPEHSALGQDTWIPHQESEVTLSTPRGEVVAIKHKKGIGAIKDEIISTWKAWAGAEEVQGDGTTVGNVAAYHDQDRAAEKGFAITVPTHTTFYTRDDKGGGDHLLADGVEVRHAGTTSRVSAPYSRGMSTAGDVSLVQAHAGLAGPKIAALISHVTECVSIRGYQGGDHALVLAGREASQDASSVVSIDAGHTQLEVENSIKGAAAATPSPRESHAWESLSRDTSMSEMEALVGNPSPEPSADSEAEHAPSRHVGKQARPVVLGSSGSVPLVTYQASYEEEASAEGSTDDQPDHVSTVTEEPKIHPEVAKARALLQEQQRQAAELLATSSPTFSQAGAAEDVAEVLEGSDFVSRVSSVDFKGASQGACGGDCSQLMPVQGH